MRVHVGLVVGLALMLSAPMAHAQRKPKLDPIAGKKAGLPGQAAYRIAAYSSEGLLDFLEKPGNAERAGQAAADYYGAIAPILEDRILTSVLEAGSAEIQKTAPAVVTSVMEASRPQIIKAMGEGLDVVFSPENQGRSVDFAGAMTARISAEITKNLDKQAGSLVRTVTAELNYQLAETVIPGMQESMVHIAPMLTEGSAAVTIGIINTIAENAEQVKLISRYTTDGAIDGMANGLWTAPPNSEEEKLGALGMAVSKTLASTIQDSRAGMGRVMAEAGAVAGMAMLPVALFGMFLMAGLRMRNRHEEKMRNEDQDTLELRRRLRQAEGRAAEAEARLERNNTLGVAMQTMQAMQAQADEASKHRISAAFALLVERLPGYLTDPEADDPSELIEALRSSLGARG